MSHDTLSRMAPMLPPPAEIPSWMERPICPPGWEPVPTEVILPPPPSFEDRVRAAMAARFPGCEVVVKIEPFGAARWCADVFVSPTPSGGRFYTDAVCDHRDDAVRELAAGLGVI